MSVLTRKRLVFSVVASFLVAANLLADNPSPRTETRLVYEATTGNTILFGGRSANDRATQTSYETNETWSWSGVRWQQRYPRTSPSARSSHNMVWDSARGRIVMFGGRTLAGPLGDTWFFKDNNWTQIQTPNAPVARHLFGMAYDPLRDRIVLYGGSKSAASAATTYENTYDTWEFDGTTWTQVGTDSPKLVKPALVWDGARNEMLMVGVDDKNAAAMYRYDGAARTWSQITLEKEKMAPCANEVALTYVEHTQLVLLVGGVCAGAYSPAYTWNGTEWTKVEAKTNIGTVFGHGLAYDERRDRVVLYGGTEPLAAPRALTFTFHGDDWQIEEQEIRPDPRSLAVFVTDPVNNVIWLFGGLNQHESEYLADFWMYQNNQWTKMPAEGDQYPLDCGSPAAAVDTDRKKLVLNCTGAATFEFDLTAKTWTKLAPRNSPPSRRFAHVEYDPAQKKTVLYGGFDGIQYLRDTWLWDGTNWTEIRRNRADARALAMMWFDPGAQKMMLYGGIGRPDPEDATRRYTDQWQLDPTNGWTKMSAVTQVPGEVYGAKVLVDPRDKSVRLFGGIRVEPVGTTGRRQVFSDQMWEWKGTSWSKVELSASDDTDRFPPPRENFMWAYDPSARRNVLFGGYAGFYYSDVWTSVDWTHWMPQVEPIGRRRAAR